MQGPPKHALQVQMVFPTAQWSPSVGHTWPSTAAAHSVGGGSMQRLFVVVH
jgi:hypothetical protein